MRNNEKLDNIGTTEREQNDNATGTGLNSVGGHAASAGSTITHNTHVESIHKSRSGAVANQRHAPILGDTSFSNGLGRHDVFNILNTISQNSADPNSHPVFPQLGNRHVSCKDVRDVKRWEMNHEDIARADIVIKPVFKAYRNNIGVMMMNDLRDYCIYRLWTVINDNIVISEQSIERIISANLRENLSKGETFKRSLTFNTISEMCGSVSGCFAALAALKHGCESSYITNIVYRADISNMTDYLMFRSIIKTLMKWDDKQVPGVDSILKGIKLNPIEVGLASNVATISIAGMVEYIATVAQEAIYLYRNFTLDPQRVTALVDIAVAADIITGIGGSMQHYDAIDDLLRIAKHPIVELLRGTKQYWKTMDARLADISEAVRNAGNETAPSYHFEWFHIPDMTLESDMYKVMYETLKTFIIDIKDIGHYQLFTNQRYEDTVRSQLTDIFMAPRLETSIHRYNFLRNMGSLRLLVRTANTTVAEDLLNVNLAKSVPSLLTAIYDKVAFYRMETLHNELVYVNSQRVGLEMPDTALAEDLMTTKSDTLLVRSGVRYVKIVLATPLSVRQMSTYRAIKLQPHATYYIPLDFIDNELLSKQLFRLEQSGLIAVKDYSTISIMGHDNLAVNRRMTADHLDAFTLDANMVAMMDKERNTINTMGTWSTLSELIRRNSRTTDVVVTLEASFAELILRDILRFAMDTTESGDLHIEALGLTIRNDANNQEGLAVIRRDIRLIMTREVEDFYAKHRKILLSPRYSVVSPLGIADAANSIARLFLGLIRLVTQDSTIANSHITNYANTLEWNTVDLDMINQ